MEHRIGAERHDDGGQTQAHGDDAVQQPQQRTGYHAAQGREPGIDVGDHHQRRQHGREVEDPADRQVDLADRQQEHHAHREHAEEGRMAEDRQQIERIEKMRPRDADHRHDYGKRQDDADLLRKRQERRRLVMGGGHRWQGVTADAPRRC